MCYMMRVRVWVRGESIESAHCKENFGGLGPSPRCGGGDEAIVIRCIFVWPALCILSVLCGIVLYFRRSNFPHEVLPFLWILAFMPQFSHYLGTSMQTNSSRVCRTFRRLKCTRFAPRFFYTRFLKLHFHAPLALIGLLVL